MDSLSFVTFADVQAKEALENIQKMNEAELNGKKIIISTVSTGKDLYRYLAFKLFQVKFPKEIKKGNEMYMIEAAEQQSITMPDPFLKKLCNDYDNDKIGKVEAIMLTQKEKGYRFKFENYEKLVD